MRARARPIHPTEAAPDATLRSLHLAGLSRGLTNYIFEIQPCANGCFQVTRTTLNAKERKVSREAVERGVRCAPRLASRSLFGCHSQTGTGHPTGPTGTGGTS